MFESEIFGHEPGAFTGAQKRRIGKLEYANGGTVFLDEIETMPMALQVKLLRVLQERRLERLGANEGVELDCRIVAASKADLLQLSAQGLFREDLYYRIGVVSIDLPRLRERREDIPLLLAHFVQEAALRYQRPLPVWTAQEMESWQAADWPGNVRELRNFAERLTLGLAPMPPAASASQPSTAGGGSSLASTPAEPVAAAENQSGDEAALPMQVDAFERKLILRAIDSAEGNVALAADNLMIPRKTLYDKLKKYQIGTGRK